MNPESFKTYIDNLFKKFAGLFDQAASTADIEAIHDMRVQIKRFDCLYAFLDESGMFPIKQDDYYPQMRSFFKVAGKLREMQLHYSMIRKYNRKQNYDFKEYNQYVQGLEEYAKANFFRNTIKYPEEEQKIVSNRIDNVILNQDQESLNKHALDFINRKIKKIEAYYFKQDSGEFLHKARQTLKELRYFLEIYISCFPDNEAPNVDFPDIKKVEEILGSWNDKQVFLEDLNRFMKYFSLLNPEASIQKYQKLANQVEKDMNKEVEDIYSRLLKLISNIMLVLLKIK